jgi:NAD(P)-dependent dehydrogenase (short-subunit alcohol dehydrogenase family)
MFKKTSLITGATSGIGYETALKLCQLDHRLILIARNKNKASKVKNSLITQNPGAEIMLFTVDLVDQDMIRKAAEKISNEISQLDVLINNAGIWNSKKELTSDGLEYVFAVNHLGYFLLTSLLYPLLVKSNDARIINISSDSHFQGKIHFEDLSLGKHYHGLRSYAQSKLANVLFTYELDRRKPHKHISVNAVQPGLIKTDIGLKHTSKLHALAWKVRRLGGVSAEFGAKTPVFLANDAGIKGISGKYWDDCNTKKSSPASYDQNMAKKLWELSLELCSMTNFF